MADHTHEHSHGAGEGLDPERVHTAEFWDEMYGEGGARWSGEANPQLVAEAADLPPGRALDVGCGEGGDALWLATRGWEVTGLDVSRVALARAAQAASRLDPGVAARATWEQGDAVGGDALPGGFDLVSSQFVHPPTDRRAAFLRRLAAAVAPGGLLLVVNHSPRDLETTLRRPPLPDLYSTAAGDAAVLDGADWQVLVAEARPRGVTDEEGRPVTAHDEVLLARRRRG